MKLIILFLAAYTHCALYSLNILQRKYQHVYILFDHHKSGTATQKDEQASELISLLQRRGPSNTLLIESNGTFSIADRPGHFHKTLNGFQYSGRVDTAMISPQFVETQVPYLQSSVIGHVCSHLHENTSFSWRSVDFRKFLDPQVPFHQLAQIPFKIRTLAQRNIYDTQDSKIFFTLWDDSFNKFFSLEEDLRSKNFSAGISKTDYQRWYLSMDSRTVRLMDLGAVGDVLSRTGDVFLLVGGAHGENISNILLNQFDYSLKYAYQVPIDNYLIGQDFIISNISSLLHQF